jgi:hypothetical protein
LIGGLSFPKRVDSKLPVSSLALNGYSTAAEAIPNPPMNKIVSFR